MGRRGKGKEFWKSKEKRLEGCQGSVLVVAAVPRSGRESGVVVLFLG